jgi:hypothetical protein
MGFQQDGWAEFCNKKSNGNATFIKVTIPNIVADDLLEF